MKTVFLMNHIPDPRMNKRIKVAKLYSEVVVICVRRAFQDIWEQYYHEVKHEILQIDLPPSKQLIKRFFVSKQYKRKAMSLLNLYSPDIIYTDDLDSLCIAVAYKKSKSCKIINEVADLREIFIQPGKTIVKKLESSLVRYVEKRCFKYVNNLVITSEKFFDIYYKAIIPEERTMFYPNIPDTTAFAEYKKKQSGDFTLGFIGGIRYLKQMKLLVDAAGIAGCKVLFAGAGGTTSDFAEIKSYCENKSYVEFTGKYDYSKDIARLYGLVDCVYSVYDADNANVRIALPNKLYEAIYCELPIIVAKGTYLSELVSEWGVGFSVSHSDVTELTSLLSGLKNNANLLKDAASCCIANKDINDMVKYESQLEKLFTTDVK